MTSAPWRQWAAWIVEATVWGVLLFGALDSAGQTVQCLIDGGKPQFMAACKFDEPVKLRHDAPTIPSEPLK